jgi:chromosomal replication initiation ATPase DnaA
MAEHTQLVMPFARPVSYAPEDYLVGEANAAAHALIERWPDWPYSILLLHGAAGSGKTHLAHVFASRSQAQFIDPKRIGAVPADQLLVGSHAWILDGVEAVADAPALAQLINHIRARGDYLLITASSAAPELPFTLPDLTSRLRALPTVALAEPEDGLLMGVLAKLFADRQLRISPDVLALAARELERSYDAVRQFAQNMDALSLERGRAITPTLVREALRNMQTR